MTYRPLQVVEKEYVLTVLLAYDGRVIPTAKMLRLGKTSIYRKLREWKMVGVSDNIRQHDKVKRLAAIRQELNNLQGEAA